MSTYHMAMYNSEHRRYDTYLSFRILVNSTCEMKMFVLVLRSNWFLKLTTSLTKSHTHFLSISYYFLLQYETDRLSIVRY